MFSNSNTQKRSNFFIFFEDFFLENLRIFFYTTINKMNTRNDKSNSSHIQYIVENLNVYAKRKS